MNNNEVLRLQKALNYLKENRKFFRSLFFCNRLTHSLLVRIIKGISAVLAFMLVASFIIGMWEFNIPEFIEKILMCVLWHWKICMVFFGVCLFLDIFSNKLDKLHAEDNANYYTTNMIDLLDISDVYWKKKYIKKMIKLISSGNAVSINDAAQKLGLKHTKPRLLRYYDDREEALERYQTVLDKKRREKEAGEIAGTVAGVFALGALGSLLGKIFCIGKGSSSSYSSYEPAVRRNTNVIQSSPKPDNSAKVRDFQQKADYWRREYYRLKDSGVTGYKLNDAEYNMNYFARQARDWDR